MRSGPAILLTLLLSGCMAGGFPDVTKFGFGAGRSPADPALAATSELARAGDDAEARSAIIDDLLARRSLLPPGGAYAEVAQSVLDASAGAAEAQLRVARLKAEAKSLNWLPTIGPSVSLTSLSSLASSILLEQVLFDNGARKAERAFAAADVEVAAVNLSSSINDRVHDGLAYYIRAQRARELAGLADQAVVRMAEYQRIMTARVEGGMSDRSEQRVIEQKTAEMRAVQSADIADATRAMAELNAMSARPMDHLSGMQDLPPDVQSPEPIAVLKTRGEGARMVAEAQMARAGYLPGLKASAAVDGDGLTGGLRLGTENLLGLGTGATMEALAATNDVVDRQAAEAAESARRTMVTLEQELAALTQREAQGAGVLAQTEASLAMFTEQYKVGRRPLMELVGMYESFAQMQREQASLKYERALIRLQMARERGVLVDGVAM